MGGVTLNASVTAKSAVPFFSFPLFHASPQAPLRSFAPVFSRSAISRYLSTIQKGTACSLPSASCLRKVSSLLVESPRSNPQGRTLVTRASDKAASSAGAGATRKVFCVLPGVFSSKRSPGPTKPAKTPY